MTVLHIDIETFSSEDLSKSGAYRYAEAPDFRMCAGHGTILAGESPATGIYRQV